MTLIDGLARTFRGLLPGKSPPAQIRRKCRPHRAQTHIWGARPKKARGSSEWHFVWNFSSETHISSFPAKLDDLPTKIRQGGGQTGGAICSPAKNSEWGADCWESAISRHARLRPLFQGVSRGGDLFRMGGGQTGGHLLAKIACVQLLAGYCGGI